MQTYLHLEDGTRLAGEAFGASKKTAGEVVFSTAMTGYPQSLTDPSFAGQILTFTYPLVGNYGVPKPKPACMHLMENVESEHIWVKGVVVGEACDRPSHYQSVRTFSDWLAASDIPGIAGIDTRVLTLKLREHGVMRGVISPSPAVRFPEITQEQWVPAVSCREIIRYNMRAHGKHVVLVDCGVKHGIIRALINSGYRITRIPWDMDPLDVRDIDAVVVSNGPGDPKAVQTTVGNIRNFLKSDIPFLGICLGHQLLALAIGADTYKLPYGHRGVNQPCQDVTRGRAYITSQNHGYAVKTVTLPKGYAEWFRNLNDGTNEGLRHEAKPVMSVQFHPEGHPGPDDTAWIFETFMNKRRK